LGLTSDRKKGHDVSCSSDNIEHHENKGIINLNEQENNTSSKYSNCYFHPV